MTHTKVISEKVTFKQENAFEIRQLEIEYPNKNRSTHFIAERIPVVTVFPLTDTYDIYLISQYRYLLRKTILEAVSGKMDRPESALKTAERELKEEAGIEAVQIEELANTQLAGSFFKGTVHIFLAKGLTLGEPEPEEGEQIELVKMPLSQAVEKVFSGEITTLSTIAGVLMLNQLRIEKKL